MILIPKSFLSLKYARYFFILCFSLLMNCENTNRVDSKNTEVISNDNSGIFTDSRDNKSYNWIRLKDGKKWMAENLSYKTIESWYYENSSDYAKYGRLYKWQSAQEACPNGWRLPTDDEWWIMTSYYGKACNSYDGQQINIGDDAGREPYYVLIQGGASKFSALYGGYRTEEGEYYSFGRHGRYWSNTEKDAIKSLRYGFSSHFRYLVRSENDKNYAFSCRCIQD